MLAENELPLFESTAAATGLLLAMPVDKNT